MKAVLRYNLEGPHSEFDAPSDAKPLCVQPHIKSGQPVMWFLCDSDMPKVKHEVNIYATGQLIRELFPGNYVGTLQLLDPQSRHPAVLHVFHRQVPLAISETKV